VDADSAPRNPMVGTFACPYRKPKIRHGPGTCSIQQQR